MVLKRKVLAGAAALSLSALLVSGTFAWISVSSRKVNSWFGSGTGSADKPGGTMHDDHVENDSNKDVYVENWGNEDLFVRIRMDEYMETGAGAGLKALSVDPSTGKNIHNPSNFAVSLISGADIDDTDTWKTYEPMESAANEDDIRSYWEWRMGGQKYYFPVSEAARENNGYVDSGSSAVLSANDVSGEGIQAKQTLPAQVLTMTQWKADGSSLGNYWVIDSDGWAYWAAPLKPGEATGLLLDSVTLKKSPGTNYYYAINVIAQMATKDGSFENGQDNYNSFGLPENSGWTEDGHALMDIAAASSLSNLKSDQTSDISETDMTVTSEQTLQTDNAQAADQITQTDSAQAADQITQTDSAQAADQVTQNDIAQAADQITQNDSAQTADQIAQTDVAQAADQITQNASGGGTRLASLDYYSRSASLSLDHANEIQANTGDIYYDNFYCDKGFNYYTGRLSYSYLIDQQYTQMSGTVFLTYGMWDTKGIGKFNVYGDGELLYSSPDVISGFKPTVFDIDISGVKSLKIEFEALSSNRISFAASGLTLY
ncbi:MAG: NPCBM/NEW2 domain-containing protein [Clostridiales bacterium]|jgi:hypothetical protein|nr:NPCBM/NEW2 domain-containing protein [Clostridiales bacterium]